MTSLHALNRSGRFENRIGGDGRSGAEIRRNTGFFGRLGETEGLTRRFVPEVVGDFPNGIATEILDGLSDGVNVGLLVVADLGEILRYFINSSSANVSRPSR